MLALLVSIAIDHGATVLVDQKLTDFFSELQKPGIDP